MHPTKKEKERLGSLFIREHKKMVSFIRKFYFV
jgi:hypothetical protein